MHIGNHYRFLEFLLWTRRDLYALLAIAAVPTCAFILLDWQWLAIPWMPIALMGTAAAFMVGFKNTQTYNRLWEARQIWGSIVNTSRALGSMILQFPSAESEVKKRIIYRHFAWLTTLRYQLRKPQPWENMTKAANREYRKYYSIPEWETELENLLPLYLPEAEITEILKTKNRATQIGLRQAAALTQLYQSGQLVERAYVELMRRLADLTEHQGRAERIKNFPYPRQFASMNRIFVWIFVTFLPLGLLGEFHKLGELFTWFTIPASILVSWIFTSIERVGQSTENPFEGGANDVPMAALSRTIEIDMREMLGETDLPEPVKPVGNILL